MKVTVLGSTGFIGSHLVEFLNSEGFSVYTPNRNSCNWIDELLSNDLGHIIYCIGFTSNFRSSPFAAVEAHVCLLKKILEHSKMDSLTYLSSTRVYENSTATDEDAILQIMPANPENLYNVSKLMGESLCFSSSQKTKVVRLSNVYGDDANSNNFLTAILKEAAKENRVNFLTSFDSSKDYISIRDVVKFLSKIAIEGRDQIYNLAKGCNTTNEEIASFLRREGVETNYVESPTQWIFPQINVDKLNKEFGYVSESLIKNLPELLNYYRLRV
jgi:nucleoside-diphosphate-sugar epimerase